MGIGSEKQFHEMQKKLEANKSQQIKFIRQGFEQIITACQSKKDSLVEDAITKYDTEIDTVSRMSQSSTLRMRGVDDYRSEANKLKNSNESNKSNVARKVKNITDFNERFRQMIRETQQFSSQNRKLDSLNRSPQLSPGFEPVPFDTTSAIAYIFNMTLENTGFGKGSEVDWNNINQTGTKSSHTPKNMPVKNQLSYQNPSKHSSNVPK